MSLEYHQSTERPAKLEEEIRTTIEEARMVLPGIQALFGFQLIAVFNARFHDFSGLEQMLHLAALLLVAVAIGLWVVTSAVCFLAEAACEMVNTSSRATTTGTRKMYRVRFMFEDLFAFIMIILFLIVDMLK